MDEWSDEDMDEVPSTTSTLLAILQRGPHSAVTERRMRMLKKEASERTLVEAFSEVTTRGDVAQLVSILFQRFADTETRKAKSREILYALRINKRLQRSFEEGVLSASELVNLPSEVLLDREELTRGLRESVEGQISQPKPEVRTRLFTCPRCDKRECVIMSTFAPDKSKWGGDPETKVVLECLHCQHGFRA